MLKNIMIFNRTVIIVISIYYIPDIILFLILGFLLRGRLDTSGFHTILAVVAVYFFMRFVIFAALMNRFYFQRLNMIRDIISDFRKGKFILKGIAGEGNGDHFQKILKDLVITGKYLEEIVNGQRNEIDTLHEFYNNIVFSISSFFIVIGDDEKIMYANDGFCKKFRFEKEDIAGKKIEDIFYFVNATAQRRDHEGEELQQDRSCWRRPTSCR